MSAPRLVARAVARASAGIARLFYRLQIEGERPPATGPLIVVANHPNALLDTALVTLATGRAARFLAKSTLFQDPKIAWLVRASGAIPVYRQQDADAPGASATGRAAANAAMFHAAERALEAGDAIALFPEGISHAHPSLAPLKTGAARLALGVGALRLAPGDLALRTDMGTAFGWARRRVYLAAVAGLATVGTVLGWVPYRLTGVIAGRMAGVDERDVLATAKTLVGGMCFVVWTLVLAVGVGGGVVGRGGGVGGGAAVVGVDGRGGGRVAVGVAGCAAVSRVATEGGEGGGVAGEASRVGAVD